MNGTGEESEEEEEQESEEGSYAVASLRSRKRRSASVELGSPAMGSEGKKLSIRRRREVEGLLQMDFGPGKTPFQTTSIDEYAKEISKEVSGVAFGPASDF